MTTPNKPHIGLSACLTGQPVRFDGGHQRQGFIVDEMAQQMALHPLCPEQELGLGVPRPAIQLRRLGKDVRLVYSKHPQQDLTATMREFARARVRATPPLDGYIFKKNSPTCGLYNVAILDAVTGRRDRSGTGVFAEIFRDRYPDVPLEEEGRLNDAGLRQNFLERVYAHFRWRRIPAPETNLQGFIDFHRRYKLLLMAKNVEQYRRLGQLVAATRQHNLLQHREMYFRTFMQLMARIPSRGQHVNVLMHILGYLKHQLDRRDKTELLYWFESYRRHRVNRVTPLALLQHHFRHHHNDYLAGQYYFEPFPTELSPAM